jgi:transcriptional regulator with GAF, ATPase, and Fis domain
MSNTDPSAAVWCHWVAKGDASLPKLLTARLAAHSLTTRPPRPSGESGAGLIWVSAGDGDAAVAALRALQLDGTAQVLVVAASSGDSSGQLGNASTWALLDAGAADVVAWDERDETDEAADTIAGRLRRWSTVNDLMDSAPVQARLIGRSPGWLGCLRQLVEVAAFTDASILLTGESGVGKEEAARLIHALDDRKNAKELVVLDCTTVVPELSGSEFFGHERGAFTGAAAGREGAFALADGGTLFLDEVGELPLGLQAQLLRVIQERTFKRVGSNVWQRTDFRLVCATNRNLIEEVEQGRFRRDLYHRIAAWSCRLPALRERVGDILPLARHFLREHLDVEPRFCPAVEEFLLQREYPGNVRDLRQLALRIGKRHVGRGPITVGDVPPEELGRTQTLGRWPDPSFEAAVERALLLRVSLKDIGRAATETAVKLALLHEAGSLQKAALRLGVSDRALQIRRAQRDSEAA